MRYPKLPVYNQLIEQITLYSQLKHEYGAKGISPILAKAEGTLKATISELKRLSISREMAKKEPNSFGGIRRLRPRGPRRLWEKFNRQEYRQRIEGALLGRMAGCTLGAPVEGWPIERMKALAHENGDPFPPLDYWRRIPEPLSKRYSMSANQDYTRQEMNGVPVDDDITYTLLGLLAAEKFGVDFTTVEIAKAWTTYLPYACTAEDIALKNLKAGVPPERAAEKDNPYCEWIGADIRADSWGYMAPGWPERAAQMAYHDAYLSHRRQGIYGEMFFSAAIAAAFAVTDPVEALEIGLTEIPRQCAMAQAVRWALKTAPRIRNYRDAREAVERRFKSMNGVHTINNACLTIFGITIGGTDFTKVIGETVAMGMDNDCTAATAGSIIGAVVGKRGIPAHWYRKFHNTVHSYLVGKPRFAISGLIGRFTRQARRVYSK